MKILNTGFVNALIHFFYPHYCRHCEGSLPKPSQPLCPSCLSLIEWIDGKERCLICAGPAPCSSCKKNPRPLRPHLSLFEACGPILPLYYEFLKTKRPDTLASLALLGLSRSRFPLPDIVVPHTHRLFPKQEPSYLLSAKLARLLDRPCRSPSRHLQDKKVLLVTPFLQGAEELLEMRRVLRGHFPEEVYSLALIDNR